ncbi:hypothetical protein DID78_04530 [Candidatus Marinamargulisbacteria bacterium SCGC AG-343-D04]|nr:hypothetical protein DID78_04530 [Candidatus Marinamargulisbacteria bacterium SCGC AG-343-D04]
MNPFSESLQFPSIFTFIIPKHLPENLDFLDLIEQKRNNKIKCLQTKKQFIWARFLVKTIISSYEHIHINSIRIKYSKNNKPFCENSSLHFNISHSHKLITIAINKTPCGIDCEKLNKLKHLDRLSAKLINETESSILKKKTHSKLLQFYFAWTTKESITKLENSTLFNTYKNISLTHITDNNILSKNHTSQKTYYSYWFRFKDHLINFTSHNNEKPLHIDLTNKFTKSFL